MFIKKTPRHKAGMVVAGHAATADAGAAILRAGGNAVDAAIAAVSTSFCAEPVLTAAGGGGFMLVADSHGHAQLYDGFARMPRRVEAIQRLHPDPSLELQAVPIDFGDSLQNFHIGQASVGTPSLLAMLFEAHRRHGKLPLIEALAPGIDTAKSGIRLNQLQASFMQLLQPILTATTACTSLHAPNATLLGQDEYFCNRDLANTLEMLSIEGINEMYHGDLARSIVASCSPHGLLSMDDMRAEQVSIRAPLASPLFGGTLLTNPPPASGGLLIACAARLLQQLATTHDTKNTAWPVLLAECLRATSHMRQSGLDSRMHEEGIATETLKPQQLRLYLDKIRQRLQGMGDKHVLEPANRHGSTTHISIIDKDGMAVSLTTSNGEGSGIVVPGTGIHLNNMLGEEDINPLGFHALAGGSTLSSMMAPTIFMQYRSPAIVLGSGGSNRLRGAILQVLTRHQLLGQDIESAVHAPRLHNEGNQLEMEPDFLSEHERSLCLQLGWKLKDWSQQSVYFGGVHAISRDTNGNLHGCGDPRRGGVVCVA